MPGCLRHIVARDGADAETIWVTEVWESRDKHRASLASRSVQ
jgi:quinol monooxygenase YgiN